MPKLIAKAGVAKPAPAVRETSEDRELNSTGSDKGSNHMSDGTYSTRASARDPLSPKQEEYDDSMITRFPHCTVEQVLDSIRGRTTLMLRDIPALWTTTDALGLLHGLNLTADYIYLPREGLRGKGSTGYAFANFPQHEVARVVQTLHGKTVDGFPRPISVRAATVQGVAANLAHFSSVRGRFAYENLPWVMIDGKMVSMTASAAIQALGLEDQVRSSELALSDEDAVDARGRTDRTELGSRAPEQRYGNAPRHDFRPDSRGSSRFDRFDQTRYDRFERFDRFERSGRDAHFDPSRYDRAPGRRGADMRQDEEVDFFRWLKGSNGAIGPIGHTPPWDGPWPSKAWSHDSHRTGVRRMDHVFPRW